MKTPRDKKCTCINWQIEEPYLDLSVDISTWEFCPYCGQKLKYQKND